MAELMGYAARANPRAMEGTTERAALNARLERFVDFFQGNRAEFDKWVARCRITDEGRRYLEQLWAATHPLIELTDG